MQRLKSEMVRDGEGSTGIAWTFPTTLTHVTIKELCFYIGPDSSGVLLSFFGLTNTHDHLSQSWNKTAAITNRRPTKIGIVIRYFYLDK
jgi:hypothetical protein